MDDKSVNYGDSDPLSISTIINEKAIKENVPVYKIYKWIDDNLAPNCNSCNVQFSFYYRRHHCRRCGRIFCFECSKHNVIIPEDFSLLHDKSEIKIPQRVCKICFQKIQEYNNTRKYMKLRIKQIFYLFDMSDWKTIYDEDHFNSTLFKKHHIFNKYISHYDDFDPDIKFLYKSRTVCKVWNEYANLKLEKLRTLQYALPNHKFTNFEKQLLWCNREYILEHPKYLIQLFKSFNYNSYIDQKNKLEVLINLLKSKNRKYISCRHMMCIRTCANNKLSYADTLELLTDSITSIEIRKYALTHFSNIKYDDFRCYVQFLVSCIKSETIDTFIVGDFLISKCKQSDPHQILVCFEVYWEANTYSNSNNIYSYFCDKLLSEIPSFISNKIKKSNYFVTELEKLRGIYDKKQIMTILNSINIDNICLPLQPQLRCVKINSSEVYVSNSATSPLLFPITCIGDDGEHIKFNIIYKFEDVRKDAIIMTLIRIIKKNLMDEKIGQYIITYNILPVRKNSGFIEIVPNSHTIRYIQNELKFSILNFIIENNKQKKIDVIKRKFLYSCAPYCIISYIFGIGDRHLDNMMITKDGLLFHIDYGYILGYDPKPLHAPTIRIPIDVIDALGGENSEYYKEFINLCNTVYKNTRRHINLIINIFTVLVRQEISTNNSYIPKLSNSNILSEDYVYSEIIKKMSPGENYKQAEIQLCDAIKTSNDTYNIIDLFHNCSNKIYSSGSNIWSYVYNSLGWR